MLEVKAKGPEKTVLVTGASSGIGKELCRKLVKKDHTVVGAARREARLNGLREELGENFVGIRADLTDPGDVERLFESTATQVGPLDVLVNNAGVGYETTLADGDPKQWKQMLDLNLFSVALCSKEALKSMRKRKQGHIINVSSMSGHRVTPGGGMYAATKYGVRAMTEGLRQELSAEKSQIRVSAISPGFVQTEFYEHYYKNAPDETQAGVFESMKALTAGDVADAIIYCAEAPPHVGINDILMRPLEQLS